MALGGPKYGFFGGKNWAVVASLLWGEDPAWKPIYGPYHISLQQKLTSCISFGGEYHIIFWNTFSSNPKPYLIFWHCLSLTNLLSPLLHLPPHPYFYHLSPPPSLPSSISKQLKPIQYQPCLLLCFIEQKHFKHCDSNIKAVAENGLQDVDLLKTSEFIR